MDDSHSSHSCHGGHEHTKKDFLFYIVPVLSRILVKRVNGQEVVWKKENRPTNWPEDKLGPWKNPTSTPKDNVEKLEAKLEFLISQISPDKIDNCLKTATEFYLKGDIVNANHSLVLIKCTEALKNKSSDINNALNCPNKAAVDQFRETFQSIYQQLSQSEIKNALQISSPLKRHSENETNMRHTKRKRKNNSSKPHQNSVNADNTEVLQQPTPAVVISTDNDLASYTFSGCFRNITNATPLPILLITTNSTYTSSAAASNLTPSFVSIKPHTKTMVPGSLELDPTIGPCLDLERPSSCDSQFSSSEEGLNLRYHNNSAPSSSHSIVDSTVPYSSKRTLGGLLVDLERSSSSDLQYGSSEESLNSINHGNSAPSSFHLASHLSIESGSTKSDYLDENPPCSPSTDKLLDEAVEDENKPDKIDISVFNLLE